MIIVVKAILLFAASWFPVGYIGSRLTNVAENTFSSWNQLRDEVPGGYFTLVVGLIGVYIKHSEKTQS